jgi:2-oxoglutarate dehydrogenase complex dehydrogenase (E1) component-like enzyme
VKPDLLKTVGLAATSLPENFHAHRQIKKIYEQRRQMVESGEGVDWAMAEALAFGTLLSEGNHVRLSGQVGWAGSLQVACGSMASFEWRKSGICCQHCFC